MSTEAVVFVVLLTVIITTVIVRQGAMIEQLTDEIERLEAATEEREAS